ncbi:hypothetical protein RDV84_04800 [Lysobacter yananisis]|jgi:hypothetical protein|uniref:Uncharacterized protein n=1 Tax=Lysobacter yananisis TaxID=1003114 RepID=A0ABY9PBM2_9GAMM|nr:hypothetical protein [Lysobacter yananisis]WMT04170.1 hypothetical protein RDV84_04800 [Lysobacter yananisis]
MSEHDIWSAPKAEVTDDPRASAAHCLFSVEQIGVASFFGGLLAGALMLSWNLWSLQRRSLASALIGLSVALLWASPLALAVAAIGTLAGEESTALTALAIALAQPLLAWGVAMMQRTSPRARRSAEGVLRPARQALIAVGLAWLPATLLIVAFCVFFLKSSD